MAKIKQRADGRYMISVYLGKDSSGKELRKAVYGKTQKEAKEKAEQIRVMHGKGLDVAAQRDSFAHWCELWLSGKSCGAGQMASYKACAAKLLPEIGETEIARIRTADIQRIINELNAGEAPLAKSTLSRIRMTARQIFQLAIDNRVMDYNPADAVKIPKTAAPPKERTALTDEQIRWVNEYTHPAQPAAKIMMYCGLRRGELLALRWSDVDLKNNTISVNKAVEMINGKPQVKDSPKSDAGFRTVPIPDALNEYLVQYKKSRTGSDRLPEINGLVFPNDSGQMVTSKQWERLWDSYMLELNLAYGDFGCSMQQPKSKYDPRGVPMVIETFTAHQLRHTYATLLYEAGVDVLTAQRLLGHAKPQTTLDIYTHLREKEADTQIAKFNEYLKKNEA